jgi:hypothetical protein
MPHFLTCHVSSASTGAPQFSVDSQTMAPASSAQCCNSRNLFSCRCSSLRSAATFQMNGAAAEAPGISVDCNVVGLYIPGLPVPSTRLPHWNDHAQTGIRNVIVKPFFLDDLAQRMTIRALLTQVLSNPGMALTRALIAQQDPRRRDDEYFEAFLRHRVRRVAQFRDVHDAPGRALSRMSYRPLRWDDTLEEVRNICEAERLEIGDKICIAFAIWQPRLQIGDDILVVPEEDLITRIRGIMPDRYSPQQPGNNGLLQYPAENEARRMVLTRACEIVRDSILWDFERELLHHYSPGLTGLPEYTECIMGEIVKDSQISIEELIAAKLDTLPFFAICIDLEHWTPEPGEQLRFLHTVDGVNGIKSSECPRCGFTSDRHSFYILHRKDPPRFRAMSTHYDSCIGKLPRRNRVLYRGMDVPPELFNFYSFPQGSDPRQEIQSHATRISLGKCQCFPFHECERPCLQNADGFGIPVPVMEYDRTSSYSTSRDHVVALYTRFNFRRTFISRLQNRRRVGYDCTCNCAGCVRSRGQAIPGENEEVMESILAAIADRGAYIPGPQPTPMVTE